MGSFVFSEKYILCRLALKVSPQVIGRLKTSSIAEHKKVVYKVILHKTSES